MRRPLSPYGHTLEVEPDYEQAQRSSPNKSPGNRAPYIVIKSPMHVETTHVIQILPLNKKAKDQSSNPNLLKTMNKDSERTNNNN